jgi:DNA-binding XRE family transcriptional regulator
MALWNNGMTHLKQWREVNGLTQKQAALLLGISERTLIRYEQDLPKSLRIIMPLSLMALSDKLRAAKS